jgi:hypothetical protein
MALSLLATQIAECIDAAITDFDGRAGFRHQILSEEWKVMVEYTAIPVERILVKVVRRDLPPYTGE